MKILNIGRIFFDDQNEKGIAQKLLSQRKAFQSLGHETDLLHLNKNGIYLNDEKIKQKKLSKGLITKYYFFSQLFRDFLSVIDSDYDLLYIRYPMSTPDFTYFLSSYKKKNPTAKIVIELPTYPYDKEKKGFLSKLILKIDRIFNSQLKQYVDFISHYGDESSIFDIPTIAIENGGDPVLFPIKEVPEFTNELKLLAVGKLWNWQGIDRVINGMISFYETNPPINVSLTIIGDGEELGNLKKLAEPISSFIHFEGSKYGEELDNYFDSHHLAIGVLGICRKNLNYSSALKHREYAFRGMPFIYAGDDKAIDQNNDGFFRKFPSDDTPIDIDFLVCFYKELSCEPSDIREYALKTMTWKSQIEKIVSKISK